VGLLAFNAIELVLTDGAAAAAQRKATRVAPARIGNAGGARTLRTRTNVTAVRRTTIAKSTRILTKTSIRRTTGTDTTFRRITTPIVRRDLRLVGTGGGLRVGPGGIARTTISPRPAVAGLSLNNRVWPVWRGGQRRIWWGSRWRTFLPYTALGAVAIGGAYYWADGYVTIRRPYCTGVTPDGCRLNWQEVAFEGGGSEYQCVQYCRRPGQPPPTDAAALSTLPPAPAGRCELTIYSEPSFGGESAPTGEDQPHLGELGWKDQIVSIDVKAGKWDFFTDDDYQGENMRLPPGAYPQLDQQWTKRIGSFMCVQGG
jgi:hypothetical protein